MKVIRVDHDEFELEDGSIHPICPELRDNISVEEFQKYYDRASHIIKGLEDLRGGEEHAEEMGQSR